MRRQLIKYIILVFSIIIVLVVYKIRISPRAIEARRNEKNSEKVNIGMSKYEMLEIMGEPDNIRQHPIENNIHVYYYEPPFGSSEGIYIYVESETAVIKIIRAE